MAIKNRKSRKKVKRIPYITVDGIQNEILDAALLRSYSEDVIYNTVNDEFKILKAAGVTTQDIMRKSFSHTELIKLLSPHLLESYDYYNFLAHQWEIEYYLERIFDENFSKLKKDEWETAIRQAIVEDDIPVYIAINILRLYKNGEWKEIILQLLQEEEISVQFFQETGVPVELEGLNVDWDEVVAQQVEDEEDGEMEDFTMPNEVPNNPEEALKYASKIIENVSKQLSEWDENYKELYEEEKEKSEQWLEKMEQLQQELKSKESQHQEFVKKNKKLTKENESLVKKLDQAQKDSGRLGQLVGELRKENEEFEQQVTTLERRIQTLERERENIAKSVEEKVNKEYSLKMFDMEENFQNQLATYEQQLAEMEERLNQESMEKEDLLKEKETLQKELDVTKNDLEVVEKERDEFYSQLQNATATQEVAVEKESDDDIIDISDEDLADILGFDNKPTRN